MERFVRLNNRGFTLVEMLIALVIILLVILGLLQAALLSIEHNLRNLLRDEAVRIASQRMDGDLIDTTNTTYPGLRNLPFADPKLNAGVNCILVWRNFRNIQNQQFTVCTQIVDIPDPSGGSANGKNLLVSVGWNFKNQQPTTDPTGTGNFDEYWHNIATVLRQ